VTTRTFTRQQLAALGVPPDSPDDIEYSDTLLVDEFVTTLKYSQQRRVIFRADDGKTYAVTYEAEVDSGDYEHGPGPDNHGWYSDTVTAVEVAARDVTVTRWMPVAEEPAAVDASEACARCKKPFDPTDTRFDGRAQYKLTPYCRWCVDLCHDNESGDHRCVICA
jgi:hypothetical protein